VKVRTNVTDDPIVNKVSWDPASPKKVLRGSGINSVKFTVNISPTMIRIKQTGWVPSMVVAVVGFGIVVSCLIFQVLRGINGLAIMGTVVGGVFALSNYGAFRKREVAAFFKDKGMFSLGGKIQRRILSNIHALQIIDTLLRGSGVTHR